MKKVIIFIHGYTGGPTDFGNLPELLGDEHSAEVVIPLLPGHGTSVEDLVPLSLEDLLVEVEQHVVRHTTEGAQVLLVGLSLGAQMALYLASKYPVVGVVAAGVTHRLGFPFSLPGIGIVGQVFPVWKKNYSSADRAMREHAVYYDAMPVNGLFASKKLRSLVHANATDIRSPILFVHSSRDLLGNSRGVAELERVLSADMRSTFFEERIHNMFFSQSRDTAIREVMNFVREAGIFNASRHTRTETVKEKGRASAVIPAYNEAPRIRAVIEALRLTPSIGEIIVVDDGSHDNTGEVVEDIPGVIYVRNEHNIGKAGSMERGVALAMNDVIFFCDADLIGFTSEHAEAIIKPVLDGQYDMFIGMRGNVMQRTVRAWGLNSGERALRKKTWNTLPPYYKYRYRIEAGLNRHVKHTSRKGLGWRMFDYSQPLKESKYGVVRGTLLRWWMNFDVLCAWIIYPIIEWRSRGKGRKK